MLRTAVISSLAVIVGAATLAANPGQPNFSPALYGDGEVWGTKGAAAIPAPREHNRHSFDVLYVITNSNNPQGQLPGAEAAPGNPEFNGGRWFTHTVEWTAEGFKDHGLVPVLKSLEDIEHHEALGHLIITPGSFPGRASGLLRVPPAAGEGPAVGGPPCRGRTATHSVVVLPLQSRSPAVD